MRHALAALVLSLILTGCSAFTAPPKLPDVPAGAVELTGDGAWESSYDLAWIDWHGRYETYRPFASRDYWLTEPTTPEEVFAHYAKALKGWTVTDRIDSRRRWVGRDYEHGGRIVAIAIFPAARHGSPYDALRILTGPGR